MPEFQFQPLFEHGRDETPYRKLSDAHVGTADFQGKRLLTVDAACNGVGNAGEQVLFSLLVFQLSGSSVYVGLTFALFHAPLLLIGAPAGALADRFERRRLLQLIELGNSAVLVVLAVLLLSGRADLTTVMALTFVSRLRAISVRARPMAAVRASEMLRVPDIEPTPQMRAPPSSPQ